MKYNLTLKLIISYAVLLLLLTVSLTIITNKVFIDEFDDYIIQNQEAIGEDILNDTKQLLTSKTNPTYEDFITIAQAAYDNEIIYKFYDANDTKIIDMRDVENVEVSSDETSYVTKEYDIYNGDEYQGFVTLSYYKPSYYGSSEMELVVSIHNSHFLTGVIVFIISVLIAFIFASSISKPLQLISKKAGEMKNGNYKQTINVRSNVKEILKLQDAINVLSKSLYNQEEIKKQMAQNYAHEIRTPLTSLSSTLEGVKDGVIKLTDERIDNLILETNRLSTIVEDLDKITTKNNKIELTRSRVNIVNLINEVISITENDFKSKNITLQFNNLLSKKNTIIYIDEEKIKSVILNLLSNACKYTEVNGKVEIKTEYNHKSIISIKDTGIGIANDEIPHIFEHLYRVDKSRVKEVEGYGIGLAIVKAIVDAHHGVIEVESTVGKGTEFKIIL